MHIIAPHELDRLREGVVQSQTDYINSLLAGYEGFEMVAVTTDNKATLFSPETGQAKLVHFTEEEDGVVVGLEEDIEVETYQKDPDWYAAQAVKAAELLAEGDAEGVRNQLRVLNEGVSTGSAYTTESLLRRMVNRLETKATWADVFVEREREFRQFIHGQIGGIQESIPAKRFRVLATNHAPENPERFRNDLIESLNKVLALYQSVVESLDGLDTGLGGLFNHYMELPEGVALQNLSGFMASLRESASGVSRDGQRILSLEATDGDLARISRLHDLLADGLEDYMVCAAFTEKLVSEMKSDDNPDMSEPPEATSQETA